jgi:thiamine pyrophosphokinase
MRRVIIIANGELRDVDHARRLIAPGDLLIAADGGARHCRRLGLTPHIVVGDLDSLTPDERAELEQAGARFEIHPARKDETDLELALRVALRERAHDVLILAALGGRWDQTLANVLLLAHPAFAPLSLRLNNGPDTLWIVRDRATVRGARGDTLSLLPLAGDVEGVTLTGLEYPLDDSTLRFGYTTGVSNVLTAPEATITVRRGILLVVHTRVSGGRLTDEG